MVFIVCFGDVLHCNLLISPPAILPWSGWSQSDAGGHPAPEFDAKMYLHKSDAKTFLHKSDAQIYFSLIRFYLSWHQAASFCIKLCKSLLKYNVWTICVGTCKMPPASIIVKNTLPKVVFKHLTVWSADGMIALTKASDPRKQTGLHIMLKMARDSKFEKFWINLKCH